MQRCVSPACLAVRKCDSKEQDEGRSIPFVPKTRSGCLPTTHSCDEHKATSRSKPLAISGLQRSSETRLVANYTMDGVVKDLDLMAGLDYTLRNTFVKSPQAESKISMSVWESQDCMMGFQLIQPGLSRSSPVRAYLLADQVPRGFYSWDIPPRCGHDATGREKKYPSPIIVPADYQPTRSGKGK